MRHHKFRFTQSVESSLREFETAIRHEERMRCVEQLKSMSGKGDLTVGDKTVLSNAVMVLLENAEDESEAA